MAKRQLTQATSIASFYQLVESGAQLSQQSELFLALLEMTHGTANEVFEYNRKKKGDDQPRFDPNSHSRFTELRQMGLIRTKCIRACTITGREVIDWEPVPEAERTGEQAGNMSALVDKLVDRILGIELTPEQAERLIEAVNAVTKNTVEERKAA